MDVDISCVLAALLLMNNHENFWVHVCESAYWLSENISNHTTVILSVKGSITLENICQLKCKILKM